MAGRECYHCKRWVEAGEAHDCWTTTEEALTRELPEDLQDAWARIRETAAEFGEQRIYASHKSIMFSKKHCYCFVRPQKSYLELWIFLGRTIKAAQIQKSMRSTPTSVKTCHLVRVKHRDEVEAPITDWMREAYETSDALSAKARGKRKPSAKAKPKRRKAKKKR
jgi:hypothetical protein